MSSTRQYADPRAPARKWDNAYRQDARDQVAGHARKGGSLTPKSSHRVTLLLAVSRRKQTAADAQTNMCSSAARG